MAIHLKTYMIVEFLVMPDAKILVIQVIGEQVVAKLKSVSFSYNTVKIEGIEGISVDIAEQVIARGRASKFELPHNLMNLQMSTTAFNYFFMFASCKIMW